MLRGALILASYQHQPVLKDLEGIERLFFLLHLELEFLAQLSRLALEARSAGNAAHFNELLAAQRQFLAEHPMRWAPKWCHLVAKQARTDFYRGVAMITRGALAELSAILETTSGGK